MNDAVRTNSSVSFSSLPSILSLAVFTLIFVAIACRSSSQKAVPGMTTVLAAASGDSNWSMKSCNISDEDAAGLNCDFDKSVNIGAKFQTTVQHMLADVKLDQLDCLADHLRVTKARFSGGGWKLKAFYSGLETAVEYPQNPTPEDWARHIDRLQRWVDSHPQSITPRVALASAYDFYAWQARGDGFANTVSDSGWRLFQERSEKGVQILKEASKLPTKDPEWYDAMLTFATENQQWDMAEIRDLYEDARKFEPDYHYHAITMAHYLLPKWSGEPGDTERFAQEEADRMGGETGDILYFRIALDMLCACEDSPKFDWPRVAKGYYASEKVYGQSLAIMNKFAVVASQYENDPLVSNEVFSRIPDDEWSSAEWKSQKDFLSAKSWATLLGPQIADANRMKAEAEANSQTPEAAAYKPAFAKKYKKVVQECVNVENPVPQQFDTYTKIGANGTIEDDRIMLLNDKFALCMFAKFEAAKHSKKPFFPPPPRDSFWIKLAVDTNEFSTTASK